jgi:DNA-binding NarL/FixJ family response regulator
VIRRHEKIRLLLADDHPVVREGLRSMLDQRPHFTVVAEAADYSGLHGCIQQACPDVILLDIRMPGTTSIEETTKMIKASCTAKIIVLTAYNDEEYMREAIRVGVDGYLLKEIDGDVLEHAIETVYRGGTVFDPRIKRTFFEPSKKSHAVARKYDLTAREAEILDLLVEGLNNTEIATQLYISSNTVKFHLKQIYRKTGISNRIEAIRLKAEESSQKD